MKPVVTDTIFAQSDSLDRKSTRLNSSHLVISYAVFCLKITILTLWIVVDIIAELSVVRNISERGGLARQTPLLAIFFVGSALANIFFFFFKGGSREFTTLSPPYAPLPW